MAAAACAGPRELQRARQARDRGNAGMVRTCARRAAGIGITRYLEDFPGKHCGMDFLRQIRTFSQDPEVPAVIRAAAKRLQAPISADFSSPSTDPIADAELILPCATKNPGSLLNRGSCRCIQGCCELLDDERDSPNL